jgi:hypothetical protein
MSLMGLSDLWALVLMGIGGIFLWWLANTLAAASDARFLRNAVAGTVFVRAGWSFVQHNLIGQYYAGNIGQDTAVRYADAVRLARAWHEGVWVPQLPDTLSASHSLLINLKTVLLVYLFGPSPMLSEAFTIVANASICIAVYLICRHLKATPLATRVAVLLNAFLPSLILWSTQDLKDPILAVCGAWALLGMLKVSENWGRAQYLLLLVAMNGIALFYRPYVGILLVTGQGLAWAYTVRLPKNNVGKMARVMIFLLLAPLAVYVGVREMKDTYGDGMGLEWANNQFNSFRESGKEQEGLKGSEYEIPLTASSPAMAIVQLPLRILLLILTPIPIFPGPIRRMIMFPEMWFLYVWVVPRFAKGVREAWRKNPQAMMAILLMVGPVIVAYALKTSVSGEAARMRTQFFPELLIFAGIGHAVMRRERLEAAEAFKRKLLWIQQKQRPPQEEAASSTLTH